MYLKNMFQVDVETGRGSGDQVTIEVA
jgi:hypothetical protein